MASAGRSRERKAVSVGMEGSQYACGGSRMVEGERLDRQDDKKGAIQRFKLGMYVQGVVLRVNPREMLVIDFD